jgi:hypothetical protein
MQRYLFMREVLVEDQFGLLVWYDEENLINLLIRLIRVIEV